MKAKAPHGSPCNNCGRCCYAELCVLGARVFRRVDGPCPALEADGDGFTCGLVKRPAHYAPIRAALSGEDKLRKAALWLIGSGVGCDALMPDEPENKEFRAFLYRLRAGVRPETALALVLWGVRP